MRAWTCTILIFINDLKFFIIISLCQLYKYNVDKCCKCNVSYSDTVLSTYLLNMGYIYIHFNIKHCFNLTDYHKMK